MSILEGIFIKSKQFNMAGVVANQLETVHAQQYTRYIAGARPQFNKIKNIWKRMVIVIAALLAVNQIAPYIAGWFFTIKKSKINISNVSYSKILSDFTVLDYLNLSTAIIHREIGKKGKCTDCALATYDIYRNLLKNNNQEHLKRYVRLVIGDVQYKDDEASGHAWIEIKLDDGKFHQYETTSASLSTSEYDVKRYGRENLDFFNIVNRDCVTFPGTKIPLPTKKVLDLSNKSFLDAINFCKGKIRFKNLISNLKSQYKHTDKLEREKVKKLWKG